MTPGTTGWFAVLAVVLSVALAPAAGAADGYLGVDVQAMDAGLRKNYGMTQDYGVFVNGVHADGPGARAGIQGGDVILQFDGQEVWSAEQLGYLAAARAPGDVVYAIVLRAAQVLPLPVTLSDAAEAPPPAPVVPPPPPVATAPTRPPSQPYRPAPQPYQPAPRYQPVPQPSGPLPGINKQLTGEEIFRYVVGNSLRGSTMNGNVYCEYFNPNGTIKGYDSTFYTGGWSLDGNYLCFDYAGSQDDGCQTMRLAGRIVSAYEDGQAFTGTAELLTGDACR